MKATKPEFKVVKHKAGCCADKSCNEKTCMDLPEGKTCGDCIHLGRCTKMGFTAGPDVNYCDFFPRRFKPSMKYSNKTES